jgi:hypothetical protein
MAEVEDFANFLHAREEKQSPMQAAAKASEASFADMKALREVICEVIG